MTIAKLPPEQRGFFEKTKDRLTTLERQLQRAMDLFQDRDTFDLQGQVYVSESGDLPLYTAKKVKLIRATLVQPGETSTTVELLRSGSPVASLVFPAGAVRVELATSVQYAAEDLVRVGCTEAGLNAQSLVVVVFWR